MSLVKIQGNPSGTGAFTIAAPNSNTDRTLTLPDATGTVNVSGLVNEVPAGSVTVPSLYSTGDTNTGIFFPAADTVAVTTGGSERARINSGGDLLVGATSSSPSFAGTGNVIVKGAIGFLGGTASTLYYTIQSNTTDFYIGNPTLTRHASLVGLNTFTAWTFGSDRRIKDNIEDLDYGLEAVLAMRPRQYTLRDNDQFSIGFIAQELKDVVPEAVTGEEVPFEDSDTPQERASKTMGVSKETLIPILVKAIQEQQALITDLTARLTALEAN